MKYIGLGIGINMIERIDRVRDLVDKLGFRIGHAPYQGEDIDSLSLYAKGNLLPIYARDAVLFTGTLADLEQWLSGVQWARQYDAYVNACSDKRRSQAEQKYVELRERKRIQAEQKQMVEILKTPSKTLNEVL